MAQRRMMSLEVIDTDAFLDMPASSQLLYFHLNSRADDDGFVANPKKMLRVLGSAEDDLKILIVKKFVISFNDGVCVIKHWRINNFVRKDIYKETQYLDLKRTLFIRPNGAYTQSNDDRSVPVPKGHFRIEDVNVTSTKRQLRIGKVREGKDRKGKVRNTLTLRVEDDTSKFIFLFKGINEAIGVAYGRPNQRSAAERLLKIHPVEWWALFMEKYSARLQSDRFCPRATTPIQMENKLGQIMIYAKTVKDTRKMVDI